MSLQVYISQILELLIKPWLLKKQDFVIDEDGDSRYCKAKTCNIVRKWKGENNLEYFFNFVFSFNLSLIENCWQPPKKHLKKYLHLDDHTTKEFIMDGWGLVLQHCVNEKCQSMSKKLKYIIASNDHIVGY